MTGDIGTGSAGVLAKAIAKTSEIRLNELESPGGLVRETDLLVDLIQKKRNGQKNTTDCPDLFQSCASLGDKPKTADFKKGQK